MKQTNWSIVPFLPLTTEPPNLHKFLTMTGGNFRRRIPLYAFNRKVIIVKIKSHWQYLFYYSFKNFITEVFYSLCIIVFQFILFLFWDMKTSSYLFKHSVLMKVKKSRSSYESVKKIIISGRILWKILL